VVYIFPSVGAYLPSIGDCIPVYQATLAIYMRGQPPPPRCVVFPPFIVLFYKVDTGWRGHPPMSPVRRSYVLQVKPEGDDGSKHVGICMVFLAIGSLWGVITII
jgi:hypothetical protein